MINKNKRFETENLYIKYTPLMNIVRKSAQSTTEEYHNNPPQETPYIPFGQPVQLTNSSQLKGMKDITNITDKVVWYINN